jgi:hypothetical protein
MQARIFKDRILAYKKDDKYLAVSLNFDLLAEGKNIKQALDRLYDATEGYLKMCCMDNEPDEEVYRDAPKKYQDLYDLFVELSTKKRKKEEEKKQEMKLRKKETYSAMSTYNSNTLCHA